jgi:hypothetical protein
MSLAVSLTKISVIYENMLQRSGCKEKMFTKKRTEPVGKDIPTGKYPLRVLFSVHLYAT